MQFYYIRHAQSQNNRLFEESGSYEERSPDPELTELGWKQAQRLAEFLRGDDPRATSEGFDPHNVEGFGLTHLYTSLMVRAVQTGTVVAEALELSLQAWQGLHESGGIYRREPETEELVGLPGGNRTFFEEHFPHLVLPESLGEEGWWNRPFEKDAERRERARRFLQELVERHGESEDRVAVISHGGFFNHLLGVLLDLPLHNDYWFLMNNTAIARLDFHGERRDFIYTNRVDFLPPSLIS
ncbi:MAG: histidine phosphatase family protein [Anaerolineales bacterium]